MCSNDNPNYQYGRWLSSCPPGEEVVISGMSGRLPESNNISEFHDHLVNKDDMVTDDDRRWTMEDPEVPKRCAKIFDIDQYDAGFFGAHFHQVESMDPMIRIFMETAIEAIMDAGINPKELEGTKTAVFVTSISTGVEVGEVYNNKGMTKFVITGVLKSLMAHRLSYYLKLKGCSVSLDTACSSSLNALDSAFRALRSGQCDNAIIGGANLLLHPANTRHFFRLGILSPDGTCRVFDENASGYVRGETIASIFLQRAKNARRIYATVIHAKVNNDGYKEQGITFPSKQAQISLMTEISDESRISPSELSFLEAHGTGTQVGDPQEVEAIDEAFAKRRNQTLLVGSVKSSIGHTEVVSGICSIIKVLLAMESGFVTPNINLKRIRKGLTGFEEGRMKAVTELTEFKDDDRIFGINNFGFGGNNVHVILRRSGKIKPDGGTPADDLPRLVCVSGRTEEAVRRLLNGTKMDADSIGLLHQVFKIDFSSNFYRGYTILFKNGIRKSSSKFTTTQLPFYLFFGKFTHNFRILGLYLSQFQLFKDIVGRINKVLRKKTFDDILKGRSEEKDNFIGSLCVQIAIVEILKELGVPPKRVYTNSYCKLVSAYFDGTITLEKVLSSASQQSDFQACNGELMQLPKNSFTVNVSDCSLNCKDIVMVDGGTVTFLEVLGRLYENGHTPQLHKLYPKVEYPVSRGTPMISPLIQWAHDRRWNTYKFVESSISRCDQKEFEISLAIEEHKFISGHVIDGRNLFPATEYLRLVWQTLAQSRRLMITDVQVVFTDCKFMRAVTMSTNDFVTLLVTIHPGSGYFEVTEKDSLIVSGFVRMGVDESGLKPIEFNHDPTEEVQQEEIYRELYLRGYNYSGLFKGIQKCSVDGTAGLIKWEDNWAAFMDKMLQMVILQTDSRLLFVPVGIKKLSINPEKHFQVVDQLEESSISVWVYKDANIIKSGGIEICGLQAKSISKKKPPLEPVLEKYLFVPNFSSLTLAEAVRVNTQIILENSSGTHFQAVEIVDESSQHEDFLLHLVSEVLDDIPLVVPDLTISSKIEIGDFPGVKVTNVTLTAESNLNLLVGTQLLQRSNLKQLMLSLNTNGFVFTREDVAFVPESTNEIEILTAYSTGKEKLIMLRQSQPVLNTKFVKVSSSNFEWLPQVKTALQNEENVVVHSKNVEPEGTLGLVNCIRREPNGNKVKCFFTMDGNVDCKDQLRKNLVVNVYKNGTWGTYRHLRLEEEPEVASEHCFANVANRGDISSMKWFQGELNESTPLPKGKVLISTYYSAVNFRDIMAASGRVSAEILSNTRLDQECLIGIEFSGRDQSGRRVAGMVDNKALSSYIVADSDGLLTIPDSWSLEEAATVPTVYSTVLYALLKVGQITRGSSILIHSATGGIGLAALNVCLHYNCEIFVTVGTQEKRDYLKQHYPQILDSHIGNSRDNSFEEMIKKETEGRGVQFVLNSLADDKLKASVRCLARGGCFLEIGKFDLANNTSLNLLLMERGASYHGVMLDKIAYNSPERKSELYQLMSKGIKEGFVKPLPRVVFKKEEVEASYRYMMTGKHIGKVLVKIRDEEKEKTVVPRRIKFNATPRFVCDVRFSYVILGGLGGFGLELADWLVLRGARKLVLVSRNGVQNGYQKQRIGLWKSYGVDVKVSTRDVTTKIGCSQLLQEATELGPVDAVFNLAVVLRDALFEDQTLESFLTSMAPKARATEFLDELTREFCPQLRHFVIFSSVSCGRGNPGQTNYGMANSVMERVCERRKAEGLPAVAIQWGAIGDVGLVAKMQKESKELVIGGTLQQKISSCLEVLDKLLTQNHPIVSSMVVAEKTNKSYGIVSATEAVANVMGIKDLKTVSPHSSFPELGMDSMMGTEIIQLLEKDFEIYFTPQEMRNLTFAKLVEIEANKNNKKGEAAPTKSDNVFLRTIPHIDTSNLPVIELNKKESKRVAFLFPGIEGVFAHMETLNKLNVRLLGVQYHNVNFEETIQDLAIKILSHIEEKFTKEVGFVFIGYSFGCNVALELTALLEDRGYTGKTIFIDGSPTYLTAAAKANNPIKEDEDFDITLMQQVLGLWLPTEELSQYKGQFAKCSTFVERIDLMISLIPSEVIKGTNFDKDSAIALYKRYKAMISFSFGHAKIKSNLQLIKPKFPLAEDGDDYQLSKLCEETVAVTTIGGNHLTMLNQDEIIDSVHKFLEL